MSNTLRHLAVAVTLAAGLALLQTAGAVTAQRILRGTVDSIDFLKHTITVDHHTYQVSPKADYSGLQGFGVLTVGMHIQYYLQASDNGSTITKIVALSY